MTHMATLACQRTAASPPPPPPSLKGQPMTTAQQLLAYHRELKSSGLDPELVRDLIKDAAQTIVMNEGLKVATAPSQGTSTPQA